MSNTVLKSADLPVIAVTSGEPAGIGPDICLDLADREFPARIVVLGDLRLGAGELRGQVVGRGHGLAGLRQRGGGGSDVGGRVGGLRGGGHAGRSCGAKLATRTHVGVKAGNSTPTAAPTRNIYGSGSCGRPPGR